MQCCILDCDNVLSPTSRLKTCTTCRNAMHRWAKRSAGDILNYAHQLRKRHARMTTFAVVKDDRVTLVDAEKLQESRIWRVSKRKAKSNIVAFKLRNRKARRAS